MAIKNLGRWSPTTPWLGAKKKTAADWPTYVCRNPNCKSYGKSHPNCECGAPYSSLAKDHPGEFYADGGEVRHCDSGQIHHESCDHFADGGTIQANHEFETNPTLAVDRSIAHHGLLHALTHTGRSKSENLNKPAEDFLDHSRHGHKALKSHADHPEVKKDEVSALAHHIDAVSANPSSLLDMPGLPGLEAHSAALAAKAATASNYLEGLKPKPSQAGPMDPVMPPDKHTEQAYRRQLAIAERPLSILSKVKDGTIIPEDMKTLLTLYPELTKSLQNQAFETLVDAKIDGANLSRKHRIGLSFLLGQPLDATMTPQAMQAIMRANAGAQVESQGMPNKRPKEGATAATQKTISKVDDMYKTRLEKIQTGK